MWSVWLCWRGNNKEIIGFKHFHKHINITGKVKIFHVDTIDKKVLLKIASVCRENLDRLFKKTNIVSQQIKIKEMRAFLTPCL